MHVRPENPIIVQGDGKVLLETAHARYEQARDFLARFAELETSPDHLHTYRITPLSLWNAASAGMTRDGILDELQGYCKFDIPSNVIDTISETIERFGLVKLIPHPTDCEQYIRVTFATAYIAKLVCQEPIAQELMIQEAPRVWSIETGHRGLFKQRLLTIGWPVEDVAGFRPGAYLDISLRETTATKGEPFHVRDYQWTAVDRWYQEGQPSGGHGVVVLPCGAGKTIVALAAMATVKTHTLIVATNTAAVNQWVREIIQRTHLTANEVGSYTGESKNIRPVTVATYQILTWRKSKKEEFAHLHLFRDHDWGLLVYDEVHLLPAPVFGATAELQGRRRLGLTATLVREDGREGDVFSLVGPKRYDLPWQKLESEGFIAEARCHEVRVPFLNGACERYELAREGDKFRIASLNPQKLPVIRELIARHKGENILVIGTYVAQLEEVAEALNAPLITGKTPHKRREELFGAFRNGSLKLLVVSKVANFSIDLPDANVAIQISGTFGSRQEEAQRLGRILRPKKDGSPANFYTVITTETKEQEFAHKRQLFLTEQGYRYAIEDRSAG
jgi:DNA excision repair protein ERCC-3